MIEALVSGSAARAVFVQGSLVQFIEADEPENLRPSTLAAIPRLLEGAHDVVRMNVRHYKECFQVLLSSWQRDRALRMFQIILENDHPEDAAEAATLLQRLLQIDGISQYVLNIVYSVPYANFPAIVDDIFRNAPDVRKVYIQVAADQSTIANVRDAFDGVSFSSPELKSAFENAAMYSGLFKQVVALSLNQATSSDVTFSCLSAFKHLPDARAVATKWVGQFSHIAIGRKLRKLDDLAVEHETYDPDDDDWRFRGDRKSKFEAVSAQINAIVERLDDRDVELARRFADQLIQGQLQTGSTEYAVKSLSNIATEARRRGLHNVELEWAERAKAVRPEDGWARALLGDTYLLLYRLQDAEAEFKSASAVGEDVYGTIGLARVAKQSGALDRALVLFGEAKAKAQNTDYAIAAWAGYCSTLREMWKPDETLAAYQDAKEAFPEEIAFQIGFAKALEHLGNFEEANAAFVTAKIRWPGDPKGYCGEAEIFKNAGEFDIARELYERAVLLFPQSFDASVGLADLHRKSGEIISALKLYAIARANFPYEPLAHIGAANALIDARDYSGALAMYEDAVLVFGMDVGVRNGRANAYKRAGYFEQSLKFYDQNVHDFPYSLYALTGRASLLKLLGKYDDALEAYDAVLLKQPRYLSANAAKASILIAQHRFDEAEPLLIQTGLRTRNEWLICHVRGMLYLKKGNVPAAKEIFLNGVEKSRFHRLKKLFQASLACCELQVQTYEAIPKYLQDSDEPIHVLLRGISLAFSGRFANASEEIETVEEAISPTLQGIKGHLSSVIQVGRASFSDRVWLVNASEEAILQLVA